jgi:hypothetical protein
VKIQVDGSTFATSIVADCKETQRRKSETSPQPAAKSCTFITQKPLYAIKIELVSFFDPAAAKNLLARLRHYTSSPY